MIHSVLFDLDGTLVNSWALYIETYVRTLEPYVGRRLSLQEIRGLHPTSEVRALGRVVPAESLADAHRVFLDHYRTLHQRLFAGPYPGVPEMLTALRERGLKLGIVTGKSREAWEITRARTGLGEFAVFVGDDDVAEAKPAPEGLRLALSQLSVPADETVYVGDSVNDAMAARDSGVRFAAALWPKAAHETAGFLERVRDVGAWAELREPANLVQAVDQGP